MGGNRAGNKVKGRRRGGREQQKQSRWEKTETVGGSGDRSRESGDSAWERAAGPERREEGAGKTAMPSLGLCVYFLTLSSVAALSIFTSGRSRPPMWEPGPPMRDTTPLQSTVLLRLTLRRRLGKMRDERLPWL